MTEQEMRTLKRGDILVDTNTCGRLEFIDIKDKSVYYHILTDIFGDSSYSNEITTHPIDGFNEYKKLVIIEGFEL